MIRLHKDTPVERCWRASLAVSGQREPKRGLTADVIAERGLPGPGSLADVCGRFEWAVEGRGTGTEAYVQDDMQSVYCASEE